MVPFMAAHAMSAPPLVAKRMNAHPLDRPVGKHNASVCGRSMCHGQKGKIREASINFLWWRPSFSFIMKTSIRGPNWEKTLCNSTSPARRLSYIGKDYQEVPTCRSGPYRNAVLIMPSK